LTGELSWIQSQDSGASSATESGALKSESEQDEEGSEPRIEIMGLIETPPADDDEIRLVIPFPNQAAAADSDEAPTTTKTQATFDVPSIDEVRFVLSEDEDSEDQEDPEPEAAGEAAAPTEPIVTAKAAAPAPAPAPAPAAAAATTAEEPESPTEPKEQTVADESADNDDGDASVPAAGDAPADDATAE